MLVPVWSTGNRCWRTHSFLLLTHPTLIHLRASFFTWLQPPTDPSFLPSLFTLAHRNCLYCGNSHSSVCIPTFAMCNTSHQMGGQTSVPRPLLVQPGEGRRKNLLLLPSSKTGPCIVHNDTPCTCTVNPLSTHLCGPGYSSIWNPTGVSVGRGPILQPWWPTRVRCCCTLPPVETAKPPLPHGGKL